MSKQLQRVLNLARQTGDRVVVFDNSEPDNSFVVMGLDEYEAIIASNRQASRQQTAPSLTDSTNTDKINRDAAMWKNENNFRNQEENQGKRQNNWKIPYNVKNSAEEVQE